jgi:hypothetical protein
MRGPASGRQDGWERASFDMNTKPNRVERNITRTDLMLPGGFGLKLLAECLAVGLLFSLGFLWGPLTVLGIFLDGHAPWTWPALGAASVVCGLLMFVYVRHDVKDFMASIDEG